MHLAKSFGEVNLKIARIAIQPRSDSLTECSHPHLGR